MARAWNHGHERPGGDEVLRNSMFFAGLGPSARARLLDGARTVVLGKGEMLWKAGEESREVALVLTGRLKASRRIGRRQVILDVAVPGDVVGDVALVLGERRLVDVTSIRRARVLLLPSAAVRAAFRDAPAAQGAALVSLGRRVQRMFRLVEDLSSGDVGCRLASTLVELASRVGERVPGGVLIPMRLRRADLASLAATTPESVSRRLARWQRSGIVAAQPVGLIVRDLGALRDVASGKDRVEPVPAMETAAGRRVRRSGEGVGASDAAPAFP